MAIATAGGHVSRAIDFYNKAGKYFSIGRTSAWDDEANPPSPSASTFIIDEIVALKKIDVCQLVVQDDANGTITYKDNKWRVVTPVISTTVGTGGVSKGSTYVKLNSLASITIGSKLRINNLYEGKITAINNSTNTVTLDTAAPSFIEENSLVFGGAYVEQAKYVYVESTLSYDTFPIVTYRQIGLQTEVTPSTPDILRSASYSTTSANEYTDLGTLEVLDNRPPITRQADQAESLSLIIEF